MLILLLIVLHVLLATSVRPHQLNISLMFAVLATIALKVAQLLYSTLVQQVTIFLKQELNRRMNA